MREDKFFRRAETRKKEEKLEEDEERKEELFAECIFLSDSDEEKDDEGGDDEPDQEDASNTATSISIGDFNHEYSLSNSVGGMLTPILEEEDEYDSSTCLSSNDDRKEFNSRCFAWINWPLNWTAAATAAIPIYFLDHFLYNLEAKRTSTRSPCCLLRIKIRRDRRKIRTITESHEPSSFLLSSPSSSILPHLVVVNTGKEWE